MSNIASDYLASLKLLEVQEQLASRAASMSPKWGETFEDVIEDMTALLMQVDPHSIPEEPPVSLTRDPLWIKLKQDNSRIRIPDMIASLQEVEKTCVGDYDIIVMDRDRICLRFDQPRPMSRAEVQKAHWELLRKFAANLRSSLTAAKRELLDGCKGPIVDALVARGFPVELTANGHGRTITINGRLKRYRDQGTWLRMLFTAGVNQPIKATILISLKSKPDTLHTLTWDPKSSSWATEIS